MITSTWHEFLQIPKELHHDMVFMLLVYPRTVVLKSLLMRVRDSKNFTLY
jgi:hypothetical protein